MATFFAMAYIISVNGEQTAYPPTRLPTAPSSLPPSLPRLTTRSLDCLGQRRYLRLPAWESGFLCHRPGLRLVRPADQA